MQNVTVQFDKAARESQHPHTQQFSLCSGWEHSNSLIADTMMYHICNGTPFYSFVRISLTAHIQQGLFTMRTKEKKHANVFVLTTGMSPKFRHRFSGFRPKSRFLAHGDLLHPYFLPAALHPCNFVPEKMTATIHAEPGNGNTQTLYTHY